MVKRFEETVNIQPQKFATGAPQVLQSLGQKLDSFSAKAGQVQKAKVIEEATIKGRQAGFEQQQAGGDIQLQEGGFIGSTARKAHNKALRAAYIAGVDNDNREEVSRIASENPDNLLGFNDAINAYKAGILKSVDPAAQAIIQETLDDQISRARTQVQSNTIASQRKDAQETLSRSVESSVAESGRLARNGDLESSATELLKSIGAINEMDITDAEKADIRRNVERSVTEQVLLRNVDVTLEDQGFPQAFAEVDRLKENIPKGWTVPEWEKFTHTAEVELNKKFKENQQKVSMNMVADRINGNDRIIVDQNEIDDFYDKVWAPSVEGLSQIDRETQNAFMVDRLKQVPTAMKNEIVNGLRSQDAELIQESAAMIDRLDGVRGLVDRSFSATDRAFARIVTNLSENLSPAEATAIAQEQTDPNNKPRVEARQAQIKELVKDQPTMYQDIVESEFNPAFGFNLLDQANRPAITKEIQVQFDQLYTAGMNETNATEKAIQLVSRNWGQTNFTGDERVMKYPIDDFYAIEGDTSYALIQLSNEVRDRTQLEFKNDDLILIGTNPRTARTASTGQPEYVVGVKTEDTGIIILDGFWKPDVGKEQQRLIKEAEATVQELRGAPAGLQTLPSL